MPGQERRERGSLGRRLGGRGGACGRRPRRGGADRRGGGGDGAGGGDGQAALEAVEAGDQAVGGVVGAGEQHPGADQLEEQARGGGAAHLGEAGGDQVGGPAEVVHAEAGGLGDEPLAGVLGDVDEAGRRGVGDRGDDHQVAEPAQQVLGEAARVLAGLDDLVDTRKTAAPSAAANASMTSSSSESGV